MSKEYTFDSVARSERYFTSLILPHLLLSNNYHLLKALFNQIFNIDFSKLKNPEYEIVSELDPIRDGSVHSKDVRTIFIENRRIAVPDLFLRINNYILIIEAKFFTHPNEEELTQQINLQIKAINKVLKYTNYKNCKIVYCLLTSLKTNLRDKNITTLTWDDIIELSMKNTHISIGNDFKYVLDILTKSNERAKKWLKPIGKITFKKYTFNELFDNLSNFIKNDKIYVGIDGGINKLLNLSLIDLQTRSHYKVSETKWSDNWITIDNLIKRYLTLKYNTDNFE